MSCYNQCRECIKNDNDFCVRKSRKIDYFEDTSECTGFESEEDK